MLNEKLNAHGGFTPAAVAPLNAITPEWGIRHHRRAEGWYSGQAVPPFEYEVKLNNYQKKRSEFRYTVPSLKVSAVYTGA
jgi:hypothetical protein